LRVNFLDNHDQIGISPKRRIANMLTEEGILCHLFLLGLMQGIPCLYYGTEQALRDEGVMDHDIRTCMFDVHTDLELFNTASTLFIKLSEVIRITKELKSKKLIVEKDLAADGVKVYKWLNEQRECLYVLRVVQGEEMQESFSVEQLSSGYSLIGYIDKDKQHPFQLYWYTY
jgi:hypothetical protein